jgi:hypothetical protein
VSTSAIRRKDGAGLDAADALMARMFAGGTERDERPESKAVQEMDERMKQKGKRRGSAATSFVLMQQLSRKT